MPANSQFAVAIHILSLLDLNQSPVSSTSIAGSVGTNPAFIRRIIGQLTEHHLVETRMGVNGGVILAKDAQDITLLDVHMAIHKDFDLFSLHQSTPNPNCICGANVGAIMDDVFGDIAEIVEQQLSEKTIRDISTKIRLRADAD